MTDKKKLSIILFSGDFDKAIAAFTLATGAAAVNYEVNMFFTFWGLNLVKKDSRYRFAGKGFLARAFVFLMGTIKNAPLSKLNFGGLSPHLMTGMMKKRNVATLKELVQAAKDLGVKFYICEMSMIILGMTKADFVPEVKEVLGVPTFLDLSNNGETLFI